MFFRCSMVLFNNFPSNLFSPSSTFIFLLLFNKAKPYIQMTFATLFIFHLSQCFFTIHLISLFSTSVANSLLGVPPSFLSSQPGAVSLLTHLNQPSGFPNPTAMEPAFSSLNGFTQLQFNFVEIDASSPVLGNMR